MTHRVSRLLAAAGLYRPLKRTIRRYMDPVYRRRHQELWEDFRQTRREIGKWAAQAIDQDPRGVFAVISFTNLPLHLKFQGLLCKMMQLRGYTPLIITHSWNHFAVRYFNLFGVDRMLLWDQYILQTASEHQTRKPVEDLPRNPSVKDVLAMRFWNVEVGKHALSVTCRRRVEGCLDLGDSHTAAALRKNLSYAIKSAFAAQRLMNEIRIQKMLVRDPGYIPNGPIYETALYKGVDCVVYDQGQRRSTWVLKRYTPESKGQHYFSLDERSWEKVRAEVWTDTKQQALEKEFADRYKPDSTEDTRRLQSGKRIKSPKDVRSQLQLDRTKKTAAIFSHISWDAAFFFGTCLFDDFEDWFLETVKFVAASCPQMNWIVKLHPFNVFKLQREAKKEESEMRLLRHFVPLPSIVKLVRSDTDINTQSLFPVVDYVLTVNGTVGMEFPCYGVPAVVAGTGRYDRRGFTIDPQTREEYFELLKTLHTRPRLSEEEIQVARKHFLALMTRRQTSLEDLAPMELKKLHEGQSDVHDNIRVRPRSLQEFQSSPTVQRLGTWLADSTDSDILETDETSAKQELGNSRQVDVFVEKPTRFGGLSENVSSSSGAGQSVTVD